METINARSARLGKLVAIRRETDAGRRASLQAALQQGGALMGLLADPVGWQATRDSLRPLAAHDSVDKAEIAAMIEARRAARRQRDWAKADAIRQSLTAKGIELADNGDETTWTLR